MKKLFIIIIIILSVLSSCSTTKEAKSSRIEIRNEKRLAEQSIVMAAVESKRFIIKLNRIYPEYGGMVDLIPRANYIIIDGDRVIIRAAYIGRQYDIRPIAGISLLGRATNYDKTNNSVKGIYEIKMEVNNQSNSFDVNLSVGKDGTCSASFYNIKLSSIRYSGHIEPIKEKVTEPVQQGRMI